MRRVLPALLFCACVNPAGTTRLFGAGAVTLVDGGQPEPDAGLPVNAYATQEVLAPMSGPATCAPPAHGTHFTDVTAAWKLSTVRGNRLSVADLDNDGYPDLVISSNTPNHRPQLALPDGGAERLVDVLMNRAAPDGGRVFESHRDNGFFWARSLSVTELRSAHLAVFGDLDNDGDLDAFSGSYVDPQHPETDPGDRSEILLNDGHGHFEFAPQSATTPKAWELWPTSSAALTDVDRDGQLDVWVGNWYVNYGFSPLGVQARLYRGTGVGTFTDATATAGLLTRDNGFDTFENHRPAYGVTACDVTGDGAPELLLSAYGRQANLLYRNDGAGHFTDESQASGFAGDGNWNYSDNQNFECYCTVHPTQPDCADAGAPQVQCGTPADDAWGLGSDDQPWRNNGNTFSTWCGDVDGDGLNDLYNAEIHHWWAGQSSDSSELLRNDSDGGAAHFTRPGNAATGLAPPRVGVDWNEGGLMAAGGDLDNDGLLDLVLAESDYPDQFGELFAQQEDGGFTRVRTAWNLAHPCMSGLAVADFDRDGDLDVLAGSSRARDCAALWAANEVHLYENDAPAGQWLLLHLEGDGVTANRAAIGARVTVKSGGHTVTREVSGGYGHFGMQSDLALHIGLGGCDGADEVTVRWPDAQGTTQTFTRVPAGHFVVLKQGVATPFDITR